MSAYITVLRAQEMVGSTLWLPGVTFIMDFWIQMRVSPQQHDKMDLVGNMYSGT